MKSKPQQEVLPPPLESRQIHVQGARTHNLKNISLDLPLNRWISVVGVSGAGKTSLVRDTLLAEGQRRYLDCCSAAVRQQLDQVERPDVDKIEGLPLPLAMDQDALPRGRRATIATVTDLQDLLATLFTRAGRIICDNCGHHVQAHTVQSLVTFCNSLPPKTKVQVLFPITAPPKSSFAEIRQSAQARGFSRFLVGNQIISSDDTLDSQQTSAAPYVIVDRLTTGSADDSRLAEALETSFREGQGRSALLIPHNAAQGLGSPLHIDGTDWSLIPFSTDCACPQCGRPFLTPEPNLFRFHSPYGACPTCRGTGFTEATRTKIRQTCTPCQGTRLRPESLAVRIAGENIAQLTARTSADLDQWLHNWEAQLREEERSALALPLAQIQTRLTGLTQLQLANLPLNRTTHTLSSGEAQRLVFVQLAATQLVNTLLIVDEPTRGLHQRDREPVRQLLRRFQQQGNTLLVVENDLHFLRDSDWVVELGPGAGQSGGNVQFSGTSTDFLRTDSAAALQPPQATGHCPRQPSGWLSVIPRAHHHDPFPPRKLPLGLLCALVGVSGSGKSRLLASLAETYPHCDGAAQIDEVILMQPGALKTAPRSFTATLCAAWPEIRRLLGETDDAKQRNYTAATFSLATSNGGRCPVCEGKGTQTVPMHFLPDVTMTCPECHGTRYQREVLEVRYRGLNVAEILGLTVQESLTHFRGQGSLLRKLTSLKGLGLEYLPLGQPGETLSQGERQRIKLAEHLSRRSGRRTLFLLDTPATGLHPTDLHKLLESFSQLVAAGHSIIAAEHDPTFIHSTDTIIEL